MDNRRDYARLQALPLKAARKPQTHSSRTTKLDASKTPSLNLESNSTPEYAMKLALCTTSR
jgi:hypothetical protein